MRNRKNISSPNIAMPSKPAAMPIPTFSWGGRSDDVPRGVCVARAAEDTMVEDFFALDVDEIWLAEVMAAELDTGTSEIFVLNEEVVVSFDEVSALLWVLVAAAGAIWLKKDIVWAADIVVLIATETGSPTSTAPDVVEVNEEEADAALLTDAETGAPSRMLDDDIASERSRKPVSEASRALP
jgi:hypothetical protein